MESPTQEEVRAAREAAGLTLKAAAELVHVDIASWHRWEAGLRKMSPAHWELFQLKAHPPKRKTRQPAAV